MLLTSSFSRNSLTSGSCRSIGWDTTLWRYLWKPENSTFCFANSKRKSLDKILNIQSDRLTFPKLLFSSPESLPTMNLLFPPSFLSFLSQKTSIHASNRPTVTATTCQCDQTQQKTRGITESLYSILHILQLDTKNASHFYSNWCFCKIVIESFHRYALFCWSVASNANKIISEHRSLSTECRVNVTQEVFFRRRRNDQSAWSVFFGKLLVEAEEVAEASPHRKRFVAEHRQRGLGKEKTHKILLLVNTSL